MIKILKIIGLIISLILLLIQTIIITILYNYLKNKYNIEPENLSGIVMITIFITIIEFALILLGFCNTIDIL